MLAAMRNPGLPRVLEFTEKHVNDLDTERVVEKLPSVLKER
jgi:hypothetical protein